MKKRDLLLSMNLIYDQYIDEASSASLAKRKRTKRIITLAACIAVTLSLCLFLFVPFSTTAPGVNNYADSEYYEVIERLNEYFFDPPKFANNFEVVLYGLTAGIKNGIGATSEDDAILEGANGFDYFYSSSPAEGSVLPYPEASDTGTSYNEVTDNQVKGVIEGDLFKRSDKYIFYLDGGTVRVYSIEKQYSKQVGSYTLQNSSDSSNNLMYLSADCTTLTIVFDSYLFSTKDDYRKSSFSVISLDVTDPQQIKLKKQIDFYGSMFSARLVDGKLYIISGFMAKDKDDFKNKKTYVPYTVTDGKTEFVGSDCIYVPEDITSAGYAMLTKIDEKSLEIQSEYALLSFYNPVIYVNKDSIYLARDYRDERVDGEYTVNETLSEICRIDYSGEEFVNCGSFTVCGSVNDQYSMDEKDGVFRVFTSTDRNKIYKEQKGSYISLDGDTGINASLYCVDKNTLKIVNTVEYFAPKGEDVKSARFDGDTAYVCTSVKFTDPVYFFDLSDINNITYKETGTIEGYSTSLVDFGEGYLLGIGLKDSATPKLEIYKEEGDKVVSVCAIGIPESHISTDYKSYYIDRERGYIGLGVGNYNYSQGYRYETKYVIFKFENEKLTVSHELECEGNLGYMRGTYIDEYIYVLSSDRLAVIAENELK